jgi:uncharacterized OB-fold protein
VSELAIMRCSACGVTAFPDRLRCPHCGTDAFTHVAAGPGLVEEETMLPRLPAKEGEAVRIGSVRLDAGPMLVVRLAPRTGAGARVTVEQNADGVLRASALETPRAED